MSATAERREQRDHAILRVMREIRQGGLEATAERISDYALRRGVALTRRATLARLRALQSEGMVVLWGDAPGPKPHIWQLTADGIYP